MIVEEPLKVVGQPRRGEQLRLHCLVDERVEVIHLVGPFRWLS
jgi:hypothetical protein